MAFIKRKKIKKRKEKSKIKKQAENKYCQLKKLFPRTNLFEKFNIIQINLEKFGKHK
jgi:hypothetical protein